MHHRLRETAAALCLGILLASLGATPAWADGLTIDYPRDGDVVVPVDRGPGVQVVTLEGTFREAEDAVAVVAYIDGRFVSCEDYYGDSPDGPSACYYSGTRTGSEVSFELWHGQFDHLGLEFFGEHTVEIAVVSLPQPDAPHVEWGRAGVTFTISKTAELPLPAPGIPLANPDESPPVSASVSRLGSGQASAPSVLSATTAAQDVKLTPGHALLTALVTVILLLVVGFPGALLGSTLSDNYDRIFGRAAKRVQEWRRRRAKLVVSTVPAWLAIAVGMIAATLIAGFIDPEFGINPGSLRMLVSVAISFVLESLLGWWLVAKLVKRSDSTLNPKVRFRFGSLIVLALAVLVSRAVGFEPGMVFGLMVGLSFGASLALERRARVALIGSGYAFGLAMVGWVGYSVLAASLGDSPDFWEVFVSETLSGLAVSGIASLPLALLPVAVLEGGTLFAWKKGIWALAYGIGLFAFVVILMPLPFSWGEISTPFATWVALYVAYAVVAVGVWAWFTLVKPDRSHRVRRQLLEDGHHGGDHDVDAQSEGEHHDADGRPHRRDSGAGASAHDDGTPDRVDPAGEEHPGEMERLRHAPSLEFAPVEVGKPGTQPVGDPASQQHGPVQRIGIQGEGTLPGGVGEVDQ